MAYPGDPHPSADRNAATRKRPTGFIPEFMPDTAPVPFCALRTSRGSGQPDDISLASLCPDNKGGRKDEKNIIERNSTIQLGRLGGAT